MDYCDTCDCDVPSANWDEHCAGWRHQANLTEYSDEESYESEGDYDDTEDESFPVDRICYKQDSIAASFSDGTTIEDGIDNVYAGHRYQLTVKVHGNGTYVAMNSRTLYCLKKANVAYVDVVVSPGTWTGRMYDDVRVRGTNN